MNFQRDLWELGAGIMILVAEGAIIVDVQLTRRICWRHQKKSINIPLDEVKKINWARIKDKKPGYYNLLCWV
jgi:hypothetical protein